MKMLIEWTEPRVHGMHGLFVLIPGVNEVDSAMWEKVKGDPATERLIDAGHLKIVDEGSPEGTEEDGYPLKKQTSKKAISIVKVTHDEKLLQSWLDQEKRADVVDALNKQLRAVEVKVPDKKGKKED